MALGHDLNYLASKYIPVKKIAQACVEKEDDGVHEAITKAENCRY